MVKQIALNEDQAETFKEAKLRLIANREDPDLDDNQAVTLLAEIFISGNNSQSFAHANTGPDGDDHD